MTIKPKGFKTIKSKTVLEILKREKILKYSKATIAQKKRITPKNPQKLDPNFLLIKEATRELKQTMKKKFNTKQIAVIELYSTATERTANGIMVIKRI
jgi:hypothetical protein